MPTVFQSGGYRLFFYSADGNEPIHIHVQKERAVAKYWLLPIRFASSSNFSRVDLRELEVLVTKKEELFKEAWNDFFSN